MRRPALVFPLAVAAAGLLAAAFVGCRAEPPAPTGTTGPARRVVSVAPAMTEILFAVGAGDKVVGVTDLCDYPPEAKDCSKVGGFAPNALGTELILIQKPDLLLTAGGFQSRIADAVAGHGVRVYGPDPKSLADVAATVREVGRLTGCDAKAEQVAAGIDKAVSDARNKPKPATAPRVLVVVGTTPLVCAGPLTFLGEMVDLAGGVNVLADVPGDYPPMNDEQILLRAPDVILLPDNMGAGTAEALAKRPGWDRLPAVKLGRVRTVPGDVVSRPGPRVVEGMAAVAAAVR